MKTLKQYLESLETPKTMEEFKEMSPEERAKIWKELNEANVKAFKTLEEEGKTTKEELEQARKDHAEAVAKEVGAMFEAMTAISKAQKEQGLALSKIISGESVGGAPVNQLNKELVEKKDAIKGIANRVVGQKDVEIKALTNRASITDNEQAVDLPNIGQLATQRITAINLFPVIPVTGSNHNGTIRYYDWDEATTVRAADMVAEGAAFPESTAKWKQYNLPIEKIGDTIPVTEEFLEDEAMFAAELTLFLRINIDLKANSQVVNGTGAGNELIGLVTTSPAYVPVASGISDASIYDLIVKVREDIEAGADAKYMVDFVLMNIVDINLMKLKKDANENYIMPPFVDRAGNVVDGVTVVADNTVVANTMIMGDRRYGRIYEINGVTISTGTVGTQFTEDEMTLKIRKRMAFLVRNADQSGFRKVTSISAALVTLATP